MENNKELKLDALNLVSGGFDSDTEQDAVIWLRHQFELCKKMGYTLEEAKSYIASQCDKPKYWKTYILNIGAEVYSDGYIFRFYE